MVLAAWVTSPLPGVAAPSATCHCFTEREYIPDRKFAADDYILTTTFNSLMAGYFDFPKRQIVMMKMNGTSGEDLLLGLYIARRSGKDLSVILRTRRDTNGWSQTLGHAGTNPAILQPSVRSALIAGNTNRAAENVTDIMIMEFVGTPAGSIAAMRSGGVTMKRRGLAAVLGRSSGEAPERFSAMTSTGGKSWGEIMAERGIEPSSLEPMIAGYGTGTVK